MKTFDEYFQFLLKWEGEVYENNANDPGGPTKFGIDQRSHPRVNIRRLTKEQAKNIYAADYWNAIAGDQLPQPLCYAVMDCAVNCGRTQAVKWLQRALGVSDDGRLGPVTLAAAKKANAFTAARTVLQKRHDHYVILAKKPQFKTFLKGWLNRNNDLVDALHL